MSATPDIVVVGSINADLVVRVARHPQPGETLHGTGGGVSPGGKGANQALAAALLGGHVALVGAVGDDAHAEGALALLRASGADLDAVRTVPGPTGLAVVTVDARGENTIVVVPGANATMTAPSLDRDADTVSAARVVVLQGEIPRDGIERAASLCTGRLILNPAPVLDLDRDVLLAADPLVVNEYEAGLVLAQLVERPASPEDADAPEATLRALLAEGAASVVLTLGAAGALVGTRSGVDVDVEHVPAVAVDAVDTTGAGDAFTGALAVRLAAGDGLAAAARFAARVSALAVQREGAQPSYPSLEELG